MDKLFFNFILKCEFYKIKIIKLFYNNISYIKVKKN